MTRHDDDQVSLRHMLDHASEARDLLKGRRRAALDNDRVLTLAVVRLLEVVGEAANRVSLETKRGNPSVPWLRIVGLRNRLIHAYDAVDNDVLWQIVKRDVPELIAALDKLAS